MTEHRMFCGRENVVKEKTRLAKHNHLCVMLELKGKQEN